MRALFFLLGRELKLSWRPLLLVFVILFLGFAGPLLTVTIRSSTQDYLQSRSRELLQGDLALTSLRELTLEENQAAQKTLRPVATSSEMKFVSMVGAAPAQPMTEASAVLVEVHAVDENYPLYGQNLILDLSGQKRVASARELRAAQAWVDKEVLEQLHLKMGDSLKIGQANFEIAGELLADGAFSRSGFAFAPLVYIAKDNISKTGLTSFGSQVQYREYFKIAGHPDISVLASEVKNALPSPDIFLRTPDDSVQGIERFLDFFSKYLSAITVSVFVLSWVASFYILQVFVQDRLKSSAILITLGASRSFVLILSLLQIFTLLSCALGVATLVATGLLSMARPLLAGALPQDLQLYIHWSDLLNMLLIVVVSAAAFTLPLAMRLRKLKLSQLLDESSMAQTDLSLGQSVLIYSLLIFIFMGLLSWLMDSIRFGVGFLGGLLAIALLSWILGRFLFTGLYKLVRSRGGRLRLIFMNLSRARFGTDLCFFALLQLSLILNIVPHLLHSVVEEVSPLQAGQSPSFFLFNLQEERIGALKKTVEAHHAEVDYLSPLILARVTAVNGEAPDSDQLLRYPVRISYRDHLIPSEKIVKGHEFRPAGYHEGSGLLPQVSLEVKFAKRQGFKIGDVLEFDLQGVPLKAQVVNLRRVQWSDFHPNFFIEFQPGVLEDAPKTWVASLHLGDRQQKNGLQRDLIQKFSDVSLIDIDESLQKVREIGKTVLVPVQGVAWTAVLLSLLILMGVIYHNLSLRRVEFNIEKMLGANLPLLRSLKTAEYFFLSSLASLGGLGFGLLASALIAVQLLDITARFDLISAAVSTFLLTFLTTAIAFFVSSRVLKTRSAP
jgi:putative ABC transport system permease protein